MTRRHALLESIEIVRKSDIPEKEKIDVIDGLRLCISELPFSKWSQQAIFDACDQFIEDNGKLTLNDFQKAELPSHSTIKNRFHMTLLEFCNKYYPHRIQMSKKSPYQNIELEDFKKIFVCEFDRIKPTSRKDYDVNRSQNTPCSTTLMRKLNITKWNVLLQQCGVKKDSDTSRIEYSVVLDSPDKNILQLIYGKS